MARRCPSGRCVKPHPRVALSVQAYRRPFVSRGRPFQGGASQPVTHFDSDRARVALATTFYVWFDWVALAETPYKTSPVAIVRIEKADLMTETIRPRIIPSGY